MNEKKLKVINWSLLRKTLLTFATIICASTIFAQGEIKISGKITDETGTPMSGVTVLVKGTTSGASSDVDGSYSIAAPDKNSVLVFTFLGYMTKEITVGNQTAINVKMAENVQQMDEVVVIGYGSVKRSDVTGSIVSVNSDEMNKKNPMTVGEGLQGVAAGVNVFRNSGDPSGDVTIRIRGIATVNNSADPLFVVDGIQVGTDISFLNPNDIDSIEILKDASATAIYGSQGANGVILITTKRGLKGQTKLNFSANFNVVNNSKRLDVLNAADFADAARIAAASDGNVLTNQAWALYDTQLHSIDWQKEMTRTALQQNYNLNVMGGGENTQAVMSIGYRDNDGVMIASNFKRLTARANIDHKVKDFIRTGINLSYTYSEYYGTGSSGIRNLMTIATVIPTMDVVENGDLVNVPVRWPDGTWGHFLREGNGDTNKDLDNPVAAAETAQNYSGNSRLFASAYLEISLLKNLTLKTVEGFNIRSSYNNTYTPVNDRVFSQMTNPDQFYLYDDFSKTLSSENYLTYNWTINKANRLNLMAGWSVTAYNGQNQNVSAKNFPVPTVRQIGMSQDLSTLNGGGGLNRENRGQSFFGRAIYSLLDRYVFTGTIRRDGSSNFGPGNRYGTFPSASVLWRVSEEEFMKKQDVFSKLNLRLGWGKVGNAGNSTNLSVDQLSSARIAYYLFDANGQPVIAPGLAQTQEIDTNLKWETNETKNVNLEMGFMKNSLTLSVEYFIRDAKDLLLYRTLRPSTGYSTVYTNAGQIRNSGFEVFAVYQKTVGDWSYNIKLNGSTLKNKVIDVGDPIVSSTGVGTNDGWNDWSRTMNGYPIASFYGYRVAGVFQNQQEIDQANAAAAQKGAPDNTYQGLSVKPGDYKFKDLNGDGYVTEADREILGNGFPKLNYGLNVGVSYKSWDANVFMYGIAGQQILSYSYKNLTSMAGLGYRNILQSAYENAWTPDNQSNTYSRLTNKDLNQNGRVSDAYLQKGDFLRVQNIQIGYTFPKRLLKPVKMESARVALSAQNLFTFTGYKGGDPEIGGNLTDNNGVLQTGLDAGRYPFPRIFSLGISFGF